MSKTQAKKVLRDPNSTEVDKIEARKALDLAVDGSEDTKFTGDESSGDTTTAAQPGDPKSQVGGDNNADASNTNDTMLSGGSSDRDSFPNTGESLEINRPNVIDSGAAGAAATSANRQRFSERERPRLRPEDQYVKRSALSGEVDSVTTETQAPDTAPPNAAHPTQRYMDNRGYSNFREVAAPNPAPTVHVPVSNMVHYISEDGSVIGSVERGTEAGNDDIIVVGGKEWVVVGEALGPNANSIPVRQNLPAPIN